MLAWMHREERTGSQPRRHGYNHGDQGTGMRTCAVASLVKQREGQVKREKVARVGLRKKRRGKKWVRLVLGPKIFKKTNVRFSV